MQSSATTVEDYLQSLPADRQQVMVKLRNVILKNLPKGFKETIGYGMMAYVVPHSIFPDGYHCNPKLPLPFINLASQKGFIALYHMGIYAHEPLLKWFTAQYPKHSLSKLDMGKSCIRFKKLNDIPYELVGELCSKLTPEQWIAIYKKNFKK